MRVIPLFLAAVLGGAPAAAPADSPFDHDRTVPLGLRDTDVAVREVAYADASGRPAAATLVLPRAPGRHPAVLFVHWYDPQETTSSRVQFLPDALRLAKRGVVSLLVDTLWSDPRWFAARDPEKDLEHSFLQVRNLRRALDLLGSLPEVDANRLHYVGHDFGAMYGAVLASVDPRPQSWVYVAGTKAFADWFLLGRKADAATRQRVEDTFRPYDPERLVARMSPAPVLFQFANKDPYVPREAADALVAAAREPKEVRFYDCGHGMDAAAFEDRVAWLLRVVEGRGAVAARAAAAATPPLVVTRATLWSAEGLREDHEVVVSGGRVTAVGRSGSLARPAGAWVIDAGGDTLLPGLIDAHVHLVFGADLPAPFCDDPVRSVYPATARQLLRSGVTSGRVHLLPLGHGPAFATPGRDDHVPVPRLVFGGPGFMGGRPDWDRETGNVWGVKGADDARAKVRRAREAGADWIALHDLGRFLAGEAEALVDEARRLGMRVMAAGDRAADAGRALALGVDTLEYLDRGDAARYPDDLVARMRERGRALHLVPIVGFPHRYVAYRRGETSLDDPRLVAFLPKELAGPATEALRAGRENPGPNAPTFTEVPADLPTKFRQLRDAGLLLAVGSDCGSPGHAQADAVWWEMETWRRLGVPPHEVVRAATTTGAALLGQPDVGRLEPGARGDLVLYRGRLGDGPFTADRVRLVAKGGFVHVDEGRWVEGAEAKP